MIRTFNTECTVMYAVSVYLVWSCCVNVWSCSRTHAGMVSLLWSCSLSSSLWCCWSYHEGVAVGVLKRCVCMCMCVCVCVHVYVHVRIIVCCMVCVQAHVYMYNCIIIIVTSFSSSLQLCVSCVAGCGHYILWTNHPTGSDGDIPGH